MHREDHPRCDEAKMEAWYVLLVNTPQDDMLIEIISIILGKNFSDIGLLVSSRR